jgi:chromosome segregation ATPase
VRLLEIEAELDDIALESESITSTLDTLEEHLNFVTVKVNKLVHEIKSFDPESIKPPRFRGLNSVEMARATLSTFFMVLLDLNVYKRELEQKCIEQDETVLELEGTISIL